MTQRETWQPEAEYPGHGRRLRSGERVALSACSDLLSPAAAPQIDSLCGWLETFGLEAAAGEQLFGENALGLSGREKAEFLNGYYRDGSIRAIFDVSGGNAANEVLPWLDLEAVRRSGKPFWGYSDCTVILNALYAQTGVSGCLWQIRNLVREEGELQRRRFSSWMKGNDTSLFDVHGKFRRGNRMEGVLVGGNLRCFLKLAGTPFFPELEGKLLFLEALGGGPALLASLFGQLEQLGAFQKVSGILLGTFTELEQKPGNPGAFELLTRCRLPEDLPVAATREAGHGADSRGLWIGERCQIAADGVLCYTTLDRRPPEDGRAAGK